MELIPKCTLPVVAILILAGCATNPKEPQACEIVSYGTIPKHADNRTFGVSDLDSNQPLARVNGEIRFAEVTDKVKAVQGSAFGVSHVFSGIPYGKRIHVLVTHPTIHYPEPQGSRSESKWTKPATDNGTSFTFDLSEEMVAGTWTIEFSYRKTVLCSKSFEVSL